MRLAGVNLFLVGMMGAGKSTIGKLLAPHLGYRFVDTDALIESYARTTIGEIFAQQGEAYFRELETKVLAEVSCHSRLVVATGGGIVMSDRNWSYLHHGIVVWLDVPLEELWQRLSHSSHVRPLLQNPQPLATLKNLMEQRRDRYAQADIHIPVRGEAPAVIEQIMAALADRLKPASQYPADNTSPQTESDRSRHRL
ncbi:MAG: shikimate kinase [Cyanobacteria bacterium M5B4]|nr:shikimate kinase [Cyanobacteria bacterium KgW148]PLS68885.1 MAG: shikimate kinase [Cyanobacteria bacterium M5B4]